MLDSEAVDKSLWFEQIDRALLTTFKNHYANVFCTKEIQCAIRTPEKEFKHSDCPCISIFCASVEDDKDRMLSKMQRTLTINNSLYLCEESKPKSLIYNIEFWSSYQTDMIKMTLDFEAFLKTRVIKALNASGEEVPCYYETIKDIIRSDVVKEGKRLFHSTAIISVKGEIDKFIPQKTQTPSVIQISSQGG